MNKYTLGTIVGTALVGFFKKYSGSLLKLRKGNFTLRSFLIDFHDIVNFEDRVPIVEELSNRFSSGKPHIQTRVGTWIGENVNEFGEGDYFLTVTVEVLEPVEEIEGYDQGEKITIEEINELASFLFENIPSLGLPFGIDEAMTRQSIQPINIETGKIYKNPKSKPPSKLRRR